MDKPLLSICIPTYNRANYLKECLDSIVCQFEDKNIYNQVEIVISDNASDDNTEELVKKYQEKYANIKYYRNKENLGAAKNVLGLLGMPIGKYAWLVGDDDIISSSSIKYLISKIQFKDYSSILLNFDQGEHNNPKIKIHTDSLGLKNDKEYSDYRDFFKGEDYKNFSGINFISAIVYNVDLLKENINKFDQFLNTCYLQSYIFLTLGFKGNFLRIARPLVTWRSGESVRYDKWFKDEVQAKKDYNGFIAYAKQLDYIFDENKQGTVDYISVVKGRIFNFLKRYGLIKYARVVYRIPRLISYHIFKYDKD